MAGRQIHGDKAGLGWSQHSASGSEGSQLQCTSRKCRGQGLKCKCSSWAEGSSPPGATHTVLSQQPDQVPMATPWHKGPQARQPGPLEGLAQPVCALRAVTAAISGCRPMYEVETQCRYKKKKKKVVRFTLAVTDSISLFSPFSLLQCLFKYTLCNRLCMLNYVLKMWFILKSSSCKPKL